MQLSVDGFVSATPGDDWMVWDFGEEWSWDDKLRKYHTDLTSSVDTILLSRKLAVGGFIDHWADIASRTGHPQAVFAGNVTNARKVIFSRTLKKLPWPNTELTKGDLTREVTRIKAEEGKDILVYGGASFVADLIKANLIDEYHLVINPAILGRGIPIFNKVSHMIALSLIAANSYGDGMVVLTYKPRPGYRWIE